MHASVHQPSGHWSNHLLQKLNRSSLNSFNDGVKQSLKVKVEQAEKNNISGQAYWQDNAPKTPGFNLRRLINKQEVPFCTWSIKHIIWYCQKKQAIYIRESCQKSPFDVKLLDFVRNYLLAYPSNKLTDTKQGNIQYRLKSFNIYQNNQLIYWHWVSNQYQVSNQYYV